MGVGWYWLRDVLKNHLFQEFPDEPPPPITSWLHTLITYIFSTATWFFYFFFSLNIVIGFVKSFSLFKNIEMFNLIIHSLPSQSPLPLATILKYLMCIT